MLSTRRLDHGPTISLLRSPVIRSVRNRAQGPRDPTGDGSELLGRRRRNITISGCSPPALNLRAWVLGQDPEVGFDQAGEALSALADKPLGA
jgi:hypothetical protein